ncbi:alpha/beta hydrolase [Mycobacterium vicinigordonae]|uniref:Alpha/beta fold hydrolase n=1 Tax=Mycobacterium vicinigordonae TaxID=1719132 RepID=A0A7D6HVJ1_9MYCO|nr:alpha/beta fold hydrolase [Mycobacterium vicinigordonae]QLL05355.1 alpha/beta fold hydrolase [Mycobacterium vicinigordonae]
MTRTDLTFTSGDGTCAAWYYTPAEHSADQSRPVLVMAHGLAGVKEMRLDAFAERFTAAGYACLVFDYRHFGAGSGEPRQLLDITKQLEDWRSAVSYARTLDGIDPDRVVLWGTSFGGGHVIITAAHDKRIAAAIAQCPFTDGFASAVAVPPVSSVKVTALALRDAIGSRFGRSPVMVPSYGPPGSASLMSTPDSVAGVKALIPEGQNIPGDVAARFGLDIIRHFPGRQARNVTCPIFFAICERDTVAPAKPTQKYAAEAPHGEIKLYDAGHFDIYVGEHFERNISDQLAFLKTHVPANVQPS